MDQQTGLSAGQEYVHRPQAWLRQAPVLAALLALAGTALAAPPDSSPIPDQNATQDTAFDFDTSPFFSDPEAGTLTFVASGLPPSLGFDSGSGTISGTPTNADAQDSPFSVAITATDDEMLSAQETFTLTVANVNDAPVAVNDGYAVDEDQTLTVNAASGVLGNDADADNDSLTAVLVVNVTHGTLSLDANGSFTYTPAANYNGADSFTYQANDGTVSGNTATVTLTVNPVNDAPVAAGDSYSVNEDTTLTVNAASGVLANDSDVDGTALTAIVDANPTHGTLALAANGSFTYTPAANYSGADSFTYHASDGVLTSATVTVAITVNAVNDAPVATNDGYNVDEDQQLVVAAAGVLANDTDAEGSPLTAQLVTSVAHGTLTLNADGSFTYTPTANYNGADSFTYRANDGTVLGNTATVALTINPVNDAPVAAGDSYSVNEDTTLTVNAASGVLANDSDVDGTALTAIVDANPTHGTLALAANGSFTYTPAANYSGADSFTYHASDGALTSATVTVAIMVNAVNHAPVASNDAYNVDEDQQLVAAAAGVLTNDTDAEGDPLTAQLVTSVAHGTLTLNADGSFTYTPTANYNGADSFTYQANDGTVSGNTATVTLTVNPVNDAPVAAGDSYSVNEDTTLTVNAASGVLANDSDVDGTALTAIVDANPTHGTLALAANGSFTYTPAANYSGADSFTYHASDGVLTSATVTVAITVNAVNDAPVATNDGYNVDEDQQLVVAAAGVLTNDTDAEGSPLTAQLVTGVAHGTLTLNPNGSFTYTPNANYNGADSFTYRANDGTVLGNTATVALTINPINDAPVAAGDSYSVNEDTTLTVNVGTGVLANDVDADGTALTAELMNSPSHGTLTLAANGSFTYKPDADFNGADSFTYRATDGVLTSTTVNVAITVNPVDDAPAATGPISAPNAIESLPYSFDLAPFFTDTEGDRLYFQATGLPQSGNLKVDVDGSQTGVAGRLFGTPALADTSDLGPRQITLTVADRPFSDPQRKTTQVTFDLTIQKLDRIDLSLAARATPSPAPVGAAVQWTFTISNANPLVTASQATLTATFSGNPFTVTNAGACSVNGNTLSCTAGPVPPQGTVDVSITGQAAQPGDVVVTSEVHIASTGGPQPVDPNQSNNTATATLNVGQSFSTGPAQTISGTGAMRAAAAGDIDGDHFTDLVLASGAGSSTQVFFSVPKDPNDPDGAEFRRLSTSPVSLGDTDYDGQGVLLVDLDGDGDLDLVVANGSPGHPEGNIVMLNELDAGQANFVLTGTPLGNRVSYAVAAADLDGNGSPDLVFANAGPNEIFLNLGNGSFVPAASLGNSDSRSLVVTDLDGDPLPDIVFANSDGPSLAYRNLGGGKFAAPVAVAAAPAVSVRAADFGGDGLPDLVFGRVTAAPPDLPSNDVYINTSVPGTLSFSGPAATLGASPTPELAVADFTMDGISDIVALNSTGTHQIFVGAGSGTFSLNAQQFSSSAPTGEAVGDFNNDGRPDLAVASATGAAIFLNDGHGNLGPGDLGAPTLQLLGQPSVTLTVGDTYADAGAAATDAVDGDITQRIVVANPVNALVLGTYTVTYNVTDRSGNKAAPLTRTVVVGAREASGGGGGATDPLFLGMLASLVFWGILGRLRRSPRGEER